MNDSRTIIRHYDPVETTRSIQIKLANPFEGRISDRRMVFTDLLVARARDDSRFLDAVNLPIGNTPLVDAPMRRKSSVNVLPAPSAPNTPQAVTCAPRLLTL